MSSNAYIATDGEKLMKVGKANNPKRREKEIDITITLTVACLDEVSAFRIEDQLRQFIAERGGIRHAKTVDWFVFDPQIYRMVCEFAANLDGFVPLSDDDSQEAEIAILRKRYFQLLAAERDPDLQENLLKDENRKLKRQLEFAQEELKDERERHEKLLRQFGRTEAYFERLKKNIENLGQEPVNPQAILDELNSLMSEVF